MTATREAELLTALLVTAAPLPVAVIELAVRTATALPSPTLAMAVVQHPTTTPQLARTIRDRFRSDIAIQASYLCRPEVTTATAVAAIGRGRGNGLIRALAKQPAASPDLLAYLAGRLGSAEAVLARGDAAVETRVAALTTLNRVLDTESGSRRRGTIGDAVRQALSRHPLPVKDASEFAETATSATMLAALAGSPLTGRAQRRVAAVCVDDQLKDAGVRSSDTASSRRAWCATVTVALAAQPGCVVQAHLCRSWDRRGPKSATQLDALDTSTQSRVRQRIWPLERRLAATPVAAVLSTRIDADVMAALVGRLHTVCGDDLSRWQLAVRLAADAAGNVEDLETAILGVAGTH